MSSTISGAASTAVSTSDAATASAVRSLAVPLVLMFTLAAYAVLAVGYATRTPIWQNPDEPAHFNYIVQVAETGTLPVLQAGDWDSALLQRLKTGRLEATDSIAAIRYEAWQPPLYYVLVAPVYRLVDASDNMRQVLTLRLVDAAIGGMTLVVAFFAAREVLPGALAVAVPLAMAGVPMFTSIAASISADPLANLVAAGLLLVLLRTLRGDVLEARHAVALGAFAGLAVLVKLALVIFVPLTGAVVLYKARDRVRSAAAAAVAAGVVVVPWLVHQVTSYGWLDPLGTTRHALVTDQPRFPGLSAEYASSFLLISFHSFWAQFGWMAILAPTWLYATWAAISLLAVGGLLVRARKVRRIDTRWLLLGTTVIGAVFAYLGYNITFQQPQGRYVFTALVPLAVLAVLGWAEWMPPRARPISPMVCAAALLALNGYALLRVLGPGFRT